MILAFLSAMALTAPAPEAFYIGTYTRPGGSRGIYRSTLDPAAGKLGEPQLAAEVENPSYLAVRPDGKSLYAALEFTGGEVAAYRIAEGGRLAPLNRQSWSGAGPCHLGVSPDGGLLLASAYGQGSLACFPIRPDGNLGPASSSFQNSGSGPNKQRQEGPHLHSAHFFNGLALACDLGTDQILVFRVEGDKLAPETPVAAPPGGGPRHLALHPNGKFVFANLEMGNAVCAYAWDGRSLKLLQTEKTLPPGTDETGKTTAAIVLSPDGRRLYVSNRGHDSVAVFSVSSKGRLKLLQIAPAGVRVPRGMALDPSGKWLVVAGQESDDLASLRVDAKTGRLSEPVSRVRVGAPVCVAFVPPAPARP